MSTSLNSWCSWCYKKTTHDLVDQNYLRRNVYRCRSCKNRTLVCRYCKNMSRGGDRYDEECCAEHDGTIKSFERLTLKLDKLEDYNHILYDAEEEITITCGASEAIACSILAILNPEEEALILEPWYENYVPLTYLSGAKPRFIPLQQEDFKIDEEKLKENINDRTKAIFINTPHNPTGKVFTKEELGILADICNEHNLIAVTDEIYEYIIYDGLEHVSPASISDMFEKTITISGFSKTFSITGWRLGYVAADKECVGCHNK